MEENLGQKCVDGIIIMLNDAFKKDPEALNELFQIYVPCNEKIADETLIEVKTSDIMNGEFMMGTVGIVNAVINYFFKERIAAMYDDETGKLTGFCRYEPKK